MVLLLSLLFACVESWSPLDLDADGVTPDQGDCDDLNAEVFPTATFVSDKVIFEGDKVSAVVGTLTLLGKGQTVTLSALNYGCYQNPMLKREVCGGDAETTIQRSAFGMSYGLPFIPDDIKLVIQIEAVKQ